MRKNILIISSSLSKTEHMLKLCKQFEKWAIESLNKVELLELKGKKINYCLGCNTCQKNGDTCVYKDDLDIAINTFRDFIKCLPIAKEKDIIIDDNMESIEIENTNAYQKAFDLCKSIN